MSDRRTDWTEFAENADKVRTTIQVRARGSDGWLTIAEVGSIDISSPRNADQTWNLSAYARFVPAEGEDFDKHAYRERPQIVSIDAAQVELAFARDGMQMWYGFAVGEVRVSTGLDEEGQPLQAYQGLEWGQSTPGLEGCVGCPIHITTRFVDEEDENGHS